MKKYHFNLKNCFLSAECYSSESKHICLEQTVIKCHLARLMGEHKMRIADVARETGLSRNTITLLYRETAQKVDLEAIDKLCILFNCEISELFEQTKSEEQSLQSGRLNKP